MDGGDAAPPYSFEEISDGEWAGWRIWSADPFELLAGPFYCRRADDGAMVCAFQAETKHMNGGGFMHGGCLMTFADYALFCIATDDIQGPASSVTVSFNSEFVDAARVGERVEARGEVVRAGGSLIFVRGQITAAGRVLMTFSAIIKRVSGRSKGAGLGATEAQASATSSSIAP